MITIISILKINSTEDKVGKSHNTDPELIVNPWSSK